MKIDISIVDRRVDGQKVRTVKVADSKRPRRCGYAPVVDETDEEQVELAVTQALAQLQAKRRSST